MTKLQEIQVLLEEAKNSFNMKYPNIKSEQMPQEMYCVINALSKVENLVLSGVVGELFCKDCQK